MELNDATGFYLFAKYHESGHDGIPKDGKKALELYLRAAELGSISACNKCAEIFGFDSPKARPLLEKAAKLGSTGARNNLGVSEGQAGNIELALRHWKISALMGQDESLRSVLKCFKAGLVSKAEYEDILQRSQQAKEEEWSEQREFARSIRMAKLAKLNQGNR
ncbi:hypothetical protein ACHAWF_009801 [Thalassiosira exigua]